MGLLNRDSIAWKVGELIEELGGHVIYTVLNERMKKIFLDRDFKKVDPEKLEKLDIRFCDVTIEEEVKDLFDSIDNLGGVVHSIAYADPKTLLGAEIHTNDFEGLKNSYHISCASLSTVVQYAQPKMEGGGSVVAMTFQSDIAFPGYNWMGVNKAALEALTRALARRQGKNLIRVNAVSAGPVATMAGTKIPGFAQLAELWETSSPLPWDPVAAKEDVAGTVVYLLGQYSKMISGQTIFVDGGASSVGGFLLDYEKFEG